MLNAKKARNMICKLSMESLTMFVWSVASSVWRQHLSTVIHPVKRMQIGSMTEWPSARVAECQSVITSLQEN